LHRNGWDRKASFAIPPPQVLVKLTYDILDTPEIDEPIGFFPGLHTDGENWKTDTASNLSYNRA
jgi:hypothetical protein